MPKGGASSLTPVYAGLREDLDAFLRSFLKLNSIRFHDYKKLFEHRGMIQILNGRNNSAEIIEFNECLLVHCLPYMGEYICPGTPRSLEERLFGLYSLYLFFYVQQPNHVVKVRMDPDAVRDFIKLAKFLLNEKVYDGYMACLKLLEDKAIKNVAFIQIHDPSNFKRFYTDEKVAGVTVNTNLNDPLGNVKTMIESDVFNKLGLVRKEYIKLREEAGFVGIPLEDVQQKMRGIMNKSTRDFEKRLGVYEMINKDHSSEQLASRGMLKSSIKEQAYSAALKLARYRRHRSSTPLDISTDTFDYVIDSVPEIKDVKRVKLEVIKLPSSSPESQKVGVNRRERRAVEKEIVEALGSRVKQENENASQSLSSKSVDLSSNLKRPKRNIISDSNDEKKPKLEVEKENSEKFEWKDINEGIQITKNSKLLKCVKNGQEELLVDETESLVITPRSIMKKGTKTITKHVSFLENTDGELDNQVHEIDCSVVGKPHEVSHQDEEVKFDPFTVPRFTKSLFEEYTPIETKFDDADMFKPIEEEDMGLTNEYSSESDSDIVIDEDF